MAEPQESTRQGQGQGGLQNVLDIALPALAFIAGASGPYGASGVNTLLGVLSLRERAKQRRAEGQRLSQQLQTEREEAALARPGKELAAQQAQFGQHALANLVGQVTAPTFTEPGTARLAEMLGPQLSQATTTPLGPQGAGLHPRLAPAAAPTPQQQQQRLGTLALSPSGAATFEAAGLGTVPQRALQAHVDRQATGQQDREDREQFAKDKRDALAIVRQLPPEMWPDEQRTSINQRIAGAQSQDDLTNILAEIPSAAGAKAGTVDEQVFRSLAPQLGPLGALQALARAKNVPTPERPEEAQERQLRMEKLRAEIDAKRREATGALSAGDRRKLQLDVRGDIRQEPAYKDYQAALGGYTAVSVGAKRGDAQGDLSILNGIVRLLDPGSVVRPSEFETARRAQGLIEQLQVWIPRIEAGEILEPGVRQRYLSLAGELLQEYASTSRREVEQVYGSVIQDTGLNLQDVFVQPPLPTPPQKPTDGEQATPAPPSLPEAPAVSGFTIKGVREKEQP